MTVKDFINVLSFNDRDIIEIIDYETLETLGTFGSTNETVKSEYNDKEITSLVFESETIDVITVTAQRVKTNRKRFLITIKQ